MKGLGSKVHFKAPSPRKINDKLSSQFVSAKSLLALFSFYVGEMLSLHSLLKTFFYSCRSS